MPALNSQIHLFLSLDAANGILCPAAFLSHYKIIKTPATTDEQGNDVAAVYYSETDQLSIKAAMELYKPLDLWAYDGTSAPNKTAEPTHLRFVIINPTGNLLMSLAAEFQKRVLQTGEALDSNLAVLSRDNFAKFISTGELPS
ncbi:MAG: hypothetical protein AAF636_11525 [Pseudomonadota bacterium]